jgi:redox-sensitive bicupin YhaK (pirin superfamily)
MQQLRSAADRGHVRHDWLDSHHSFSFGGYYDPQWMGFSALRVINEDRVDPDAGFPTHSHRDMEIISYVLDGGLRHRDSTGGGSVLLPGELQLMSAGHGISHSEMNASRVDPVHFLQIWIVPDKGGITPGYQQKALDAEALRKGFTAVIAPAAEAAPFSIQQDARVLIAWPVAGQVLDQTLQPTRPYYLHVARGDVTVGDRTLSAGDALMLTGESALQVKAETEAELLLFDLPAAKS